MKFIPKVISILCISVNLIACAENVLPQASTKKNIIKKSVYKYAGSTQCNTGKGLTLEEMKRQLVSAHINVLTAACGNDGKMRATMCGAPDGKIGIFEIPTDQFDVALKIGFLSIDQLTDAVKVPCQ